MSAFGTCRLLLHSAPLLCNSCGLYSYGLYSYGLYSYGLYSYDQQRLIGVGQAWWCVGTKEQVLDALEPLGLRCLDGGYQLGRSADLFLMICI